MSNTALLRRLRALEHKWTPPQEPRCYSICLEEGTEVSEALRSKMNKYDQLVIRYYPKGYFGEDEKSTYGQVMSCWLRGPHGQKKPCVVREYGGVDISNV